MRGDFEMGGTPIADSLYDGLRKRTGSANRRVDPDTLEEFFCGCEPEKLPPISGPVTMKDGTVLVPHDAVQHPAHYKRFGKEVIDIIRDTLGPEGFAAYCQGNEIKYRLRAGFKNDGSEDLAKAMKYYEFRTGVK